MDVGLGPMLFVLIVSMTAVRSQIEQGPVNALKKVGDSVTLECVTVKKNCEQIEWQKVEGLQSPKLVYRNGQGMLNTDSYPSQRYSVNERRGCSLTIIQLEISDSGRFICMQAVDIEQTRSSILVVIDVTESCLSNVTGNALDKDDGYSLWCAIKVPPKSVEPSNVTLSFQNKAVGETETTDDKQPLTVKTMLTGTAKEENITPRGCKASFPPNTEANYDKTTASLDVCNTTELIVSHSVENVTVLTSGPLSDVDTVRYTTDGHPSTTFKSTHSRSGDVIDGDTRVISGDFGDEYTSTATNMVKGRVASQSITIEVSSALPATRPTVRSQIQKGPANALKKVGDNVTLECVTVNKNCDKVDWQKVEGIQSPKLVYRNGSGMLNNGVFSPQRHSVNESYGCNLTITQLEINDSGKFICVQQVGEREETRTFNLVVINPVKNIAVSTPCPYYKGDKVRCTADGQPPPTFKWIHLKSGDVVDGDTLVIMGDAGDKYTCTATNTVNGKETSQNITVEVSSPPLSPVVRSEIQRGPANALKKVCDSVMLKCVTSSNNCDKIDWAKLEGLQSPKLVYRNGQGMLNSNIYPIRRYSVNERRGCSLTIRQLEMSDSGRFICMQAMGDMEYNYRTSILVVIDVTESCTSNVTSNALDKGDAYSLWCAINIPPKSLEPTIVTLSFHNKAVGETETTDENQPQTVHTTLTGIATKANIMRVCRASFGPITQANYDSTTATLDICTTLWIVSYPVENIFISVSPPVPDKGYMVRCTADGHPPPTFKWTNLKNGDVVDGDTMAIKGNAGDKYTCTATNTFKGRVASQSITIEFTSIHAEDYGAMKIGPLASSDNGRQDAEVADCGPGCIAGVVCGCLIIGVVIGAVAYAGLKDERSRVYVLIHFRKKKKKNGQNGETEDVPSNGSKPSGSPK